MIKMLTNLYNRSFMVGTVLTWMLLLMGSTSVLAQEISTPTISAINVNNTAVTFDVTVGTSTSTTLSSLEYRLGSTGTWTTTTTTPVVGGTNGTFTANVANLETGTTYTMYVRVVGTASATTSAETSFQFTTTTLTAPTGLVLTASWRQLSLTFNAPLSDGGNGITGYQYSTDGGTSWAPFNSVTPPIVLTGLANNTEYSLLLRAVNAKGVGVTSTVVKGTPIAIANEPTGIVVTPSNSSLLLGFTRPSIIGNGDFDTSVPVTNYQYSLDNGATWVTRSPASTTSPILVEGLSMNTPYQVRVRAVNVVGGGVPSTMTQTTTYNLTAPTALVATAGNRQLTVSFTAPATTSHSAITNYQYKVDDLGWVDTNTSTTSFMIPNLTNGITYSVRVRAVNGGGVGAESAVVTGVPRDVNAVANIQFINNANVGAVDVFAEGTKIRNDLAYQTATAFLNVDGGEELNLTFTNADNTATLGTLTSTFTVGGNYIIVFQGGTNSKAFEVEVIENARRVSTSATGVQYLFVHGITNAGKLNVERVSTTTPRTLEQLVGVGVDYGTFTSYQTFDKPGITTLQLLNNPARTLVGQFMFDLGSYDGKTVTLVGTGLVDGADANKLNVLGFDVNGNVITPRISTSDDNQEVNIPTEFTLHGNFPNPFNPTTNIRFDLPEQANVRIEVVDLLGRNVLTVAPQSMTAGSNKVITLDAARLSSGIYFYRLIAEGKSSTSIKTSKFTLIK